MKQLEKRFYAREEIAEFLNVNIKNKNFARDVKNILTNWGYGYEYSRKGVNIFKAPTSAAERLSEIMIRNYGLDIQVDAKAFACFLVAFAEVECFDAMPWSEREKSMKECYGISVSEKTLRNWCNKLMRSNTIEKGGEKVYWCTEGAKENKKRYMVEPGSPEDEEMINYMKTRSKLLETYISDAIASGRKDYKQINAEAWQKTNTALWRDYGCCYYSCKSLVLSAFDDFNAHEIYELITEVAEEEETVLRVDVSIGITR